MAIHLKRVYDEPSEADGYRVLVDRLWPRGLSKERAHIDLWLQRIAPTTELRDRYHHEPANWPDFEERYREELAGHEDLLGLIRDIERHEKVVTLLFGAKDEKRNQATVLLEVLNGKPAPRT